MCDAVPETHAFGFQEQPVARDYGAPQLDLVQGEQVRQFFADVVFPQQEEACELRHGLDLEHSGHHRLSGPVPLEKRFVEGEVLYAHCPAVAFEFEDVPWRTMVFTTLVLSQMGNALAMRSSRDSLFKIGVFSNRLMVGAVLLTFVLQLIIIYVPLFQGVFSTEPLTIEQLLICLGASAIVFVILETYKWVKRIKERAS